MRRFGVVCYFALAAFVLCDGEAQAQAAEKIVIGHLWEETTVQHRELLWAVQQIERRLNSNYRLEIYPRGQLGATDAEITETFRNGTVDMSFFNTGHAATIYPPISIAGAPFTFRDFDHWQTFRDSPLYQTLQAGFEAAAGAKVFGLTYYGERHISSKRPIRNIADLNGLLIRVPNKQSLLSTFRALGARPVALPFKETYEALKTGLVEAEENPLPTILAMRFHEVSPVITLTRHVTDSELIVMSSQRWERLGVPDRAILADIFREVTARITAAVRSQEVALETAFRQQGVEINDIDRGPLMGIIEPLLRSEVFPWGDDLYEQVRALR